MTITQDTRILEDGSLCFGGHRITPATWQRQPAPATPGRSVSLTEAFAALAQQASLRHLVVAVIGPRAATPAQEQAAEAVGRALGGYGITLICGGKTGVMAAASKGCHAAGGMMIGILPGTDPAEANPFVSIALPTGLSEGRNMVIARAARVLVAIGGSYGTLSEVAYGLHFDKPVITLEDAPQIDGVRPARTVAEAVDLTLAALLDQARSPDHV